MYRSMEEAQEMLTLAQRHISDELLQQVERHQGCFDMVKAPSRSGSEGAMAAMELFHRLQRNPWEPPVSAERAEDMVIAMEEELQAAWAVRKILAQPYGEVFASDEL
eukprot:symbB.v1.2.015300.t1/scaffold1134.1/size135964/12